MPLKIVWISFVRYCSKLHGLNNTNVLSYSSINQIPMGVHQSKIKVVAGLHSLLEIPRKGLFPCLFQLLYAVCLRWFIAPSSTFKASNVACPADLTGERFSTFKDSWNYTGPTWIFQNTLPMPRFIITFEKSLWPCKITYSQVLEIRLWPTLGAIILPSTLYKAKMKQCSRKHIDHRGLPQMKIISLHLMGFFMIKFTVQYVPHPTPHTKKTRG